MTSEVRFGVTLPHTASGFRVVRDIALLAESLGFHSVWVYDHFAGPILEAWTTLSAVASITSRVRLGTFVLCNAFRNPGLLAKMCTTLDQISGGRLILGIGAGSSPHENRAYGIPYPDNATRLRQLVETVKILRGIWRQEKFSFKGEFYDIFEVNNLPRPVQKPCIPLMIGGQGEKVMLKIMARYADIVNFSDALSPEGYARKIGIVRGYCRVVGRPFEEIERSWIGQVVIAPSDEELKALLNRVVPSGMSVEEYEGPNIVGTPFQCAAKVKRYVEAGVQHFITGFPGPDMGRSMQLFARDVLHSSA